MIFKLYYLHFRAPVEYPWVVSVRHLGDCAFDRGGMSKGGGKNRRDSLSAEFKKLRRNNTLSFFVYFPRSFPCLNFLLSRTSPTAAASNASTHTRHPLQPAVIIMVLGGFKLKPALCAGPADKSQSYVWGGFCELKAPIDIISHTHTHLRIKLVTHTCVRSVSPHVA